MINERGVALRKDVQPKLKEDHVPIASQIVPRGFDT